MDSPTIRSQSCRLAGAAFLLGLGALLAGGPVGAAAVGRIAGSGSVDSGGGASWTVPVRVSPGVNGLAPEVALVYRSQAGDGPAGHGVNISGPSRITRCPRTVATDGRVRGVQFDPGDRFCLDGRVLVLVAGSYGGDGAEYRAEIDRLERIWSRGRQGSGPATFEVRLPDGTARFYGSTANARIAAPGTAGEVREWAQSATRDLFGNQVVYRYLEDATLAEAWPAEIRWTTDANGAGGRFRLLFDYAGRPASATRRGFVWDSPWQRDRQLATIRYEADEGQGYTLVHRYTLGYAPGPSGRSRLVSLEQCAPASCLPPTTFTWQDGTPAFGGLVVGPAETSPGDAIFLDVDGDGATDLLVPVGAAGSQRWYLRRATPTASSLLAATSVDTGIVRAGAAYPMDFDGDGRRDLLTVGPTSPATWRVHRSTGTGFAAAIDTGVPATLMTGTATPLDVDGDGRDDLVYQRDRRVWFRLSTGNGFGPEQPTSIEAFGPDLYLPIISGVAPPVDFDGDGRADLLVRRQVISAVAPPPFFEGFRSTGTDLVLAFTTAPSHDALPLDVNGDGLTDLLLRDASSFRWVVRTSQGRTLGAPVASGIPQNPPILRIADWNGDGRDDLVRDLGTTGFRVHLADDGAATPYSDTDPARYADLTGSPKPTEASLALVDLTGDGLADLLHYRPGSGRWETRRRTSPRPDLLTRAVDGLGNSWQVAYQPLAGLSTYVVDATDGPGDRLLRGGPLAVVTAVTESDGAGGSFTTNYRYWNGRMSRIGRGFLGFAAVRATDSRYPAIHGIDVYTETAYRQDFPLVGAASGVLTRRADGHRFRMTSNNWASSSRPAPADPAAATHFVSLTREVAEDYETDPEGGALGTLVRRSERTLTWDPTHGVVTRDVVVTTSPDQTDTHTTTTVRTFDEAARLAAGCLGPVTREDVTEAVSPGDTATRTTTATWSSATCRRLSTTTGAPEGPAAQLVTSYTYDGLGQPTGIGRRPADGSLPERRTLISYAPGSQRPVTETEVLDGAPAHVTQHRWHFGLDVELSRTDPRGLVSTWRWDGFGRLTRESQADATGGGSTVAYLPCDESCFAPHAAYQVASLRDDGFWSRTLHDPLGREVGRELPLTGGEASRQVTRYDPFGRVARESVPQAGGAPAYWVERGYEPGGRPRFEDRPAAGGGARTRWTYARLATTTTDAEGRAVTRATDARSRLVRVSSALGGDARYAWTPFGELAAITDANGTMTRLAYDGRGLVATVSSPDSGTRTTTWNAFGELATEAADAGAPTLATYAYDQLGRLVRRTDAAGTAAWEYGTTAGSGFGQPARVSTPAGGGNAAFAESYAYDAGGRRNRVSTTIDGTTYVTDVTWDALGRVATITYPATVDGNRPRFRYGYDGAGYLGVVEQDVAGGGAWVPLYTLRAQDAIGRPRHVRLGGTTPLDQQFLIDPATLRLAGIRTGTNLGAERQHLDYRWDRVGNLVERADRNAGLVETFSFDDLDRLTAAQLNGTQTLAISWDAGGRIRSRSDVGTYTYATSRPSAVAGVSGGPRGSLTYLHDRNGNVVSRNGQRISWTVFNQPLRIAYGSSDYAEFGYGPARQRVRQVARTAGVTRTTHYVGPHFEVEIEGSTRRYRSSVFANGEAFYSQVEQSAPAAFDAYFLHRDHQGSVDTLTRVVGTGPDVRRQSYDAFGKRRNANWTADAADQRYGDAHFTERGFTGHEHLDNVRLIHMNGRLQDPLLGVMLSPDPLLGELADPQTLNRYAYVAGNGVSATDPSGYFLRRLVKNIGRALRSIASFVRRVVRHYGRELVAAVAAYYTAGAVSSWYVGAAGASAGAAVEAQMLGGFAGGAVSGAIARGDPMAIVAGGLSGGILRTIDLKFGAAWTAERVATQAAVTGTLAHVQGGDFRSGLVAGLGSGVARYAYARVVGYEATWGAGGAAEPKSRYQLPVAGANNFGEARTWVDPADFFGEGGRLSRFMNRIPGMNAIAGLHDVMQVNWDRWGGTGLRTAMNVPGMGPAALLTYPALLDGATATRLGDRDD